MQPWLSAPTINILEIFLPVSGSKSSHLPVPHPWLPEAKPTLAQLSIPGRPRNGVQIKKGYVFYCFKVCCLIPPKWNCFYNKKKKRKRNKTFWLQLCQRQRCSRFSFLSMDRVWWRFRPQDYSHIPKYGHKVTGQWPKKHSKTSAPTNWLILNAVFKNTF